MKLRHLVILGIAAFAVVLCWFGLESSHRPAYAPSSTTPPPAPKLSLTSTSPLAGGTTVSNVPLKTPKVALPQAGSHPPSKPATLAAGPATKDPQKRELANPLAPSSAPPVVIPASVLPPDPAAEIELDKVTRMLRDYRTLMGENPVGTNAEIMRAIMGDNPRQAILGPPEGLSLNGSGELTDHWGTPLFFHQLSADLMEIRSAGPDRKMYTGDDIVTK